MGPTDRKCDLLAAAVAVGFVVSLCVIAFQYHVIEDNERNNPEEDFYVSYASRVGQGKLPGDPFRPWLYHFCAGLVGSSCRDYFVGCQVVSLVSALLFVVCTYMLGKRLFSPSAGLLAMFLVALNIDVIMAGVRAASDMLFSALVLLCPLCACACLERHSTSPEGSDHRAMACLGILFGLAFVTRYQALLLLPALVYALLSSCQGFDAGSRRSRMMVRGLIFMVTFSAIGLVQGAANSLCFGFANPGQVYKNVSVFWFGLRGQHHLAFFDQHTPEEFLRRILDQPLAPLRAVTENLWAFLAYRFPMMLGGRNIILGLVLLALCVWWFRKNVGKSACAAITMFVASYVLGIGIIFFLENRMVLPVLAIGCIGSSCFLVDTATKRRRTGVMSIAAVVALSAFCGRSNVQAYLSKHSPGDLAAARALHGLSLEGNPKVLGTSLYIANHVPLNYKYFDSLYVISDETVYNRELLEAIVQDRPSYMIVGRVSSYGNPTPRAILTAPNSVFPFLVPMGVIGETVVYRVDRRLLASPARP